MIVKYRLESRKKGDLPKKIEVQNDELSALQKRLEAKKRQRKQEQAAQRIGASAESAQRTRSLINQKVCCRHTIMYDYYMIHYIPWLYPPALQCVCWGQCTVFMLSVFLYIFLSITDALGFL